jgi:hypothetical protein
MQNWYAVESEAKHRVLEWDRAIAADARSAMAIPGGRTTPRWMPLSHLSLWSLKLKRLLVDGVSWITSITSCKSAKELDTAVQPNQAS